MGVITDRTGYFRLLGYTGRKGPFKGVPMYIPWSRYITQRAVLRILQTGFALVLLLLALACVIAIRGARGIQADAEAVLREELSFAHLLNQAQIGESTMAAVLHRIESRQPATKSSRSLQDLELANQALHKAAAAAQQTPEASDWRELSKSAEQFTKIASEAIRADDRSNATLELLSALHNNLNHHMQRIVNSSMQRAITVDRVLAGRSRELAEESLWLLGGCFVLSVIFAGLTIQMARAGVRKMEWQASELGRVSWHMLQTQEEAARRFSHELHDELGQTLAAIRANLQQPRFSARRADTLNLVDSAIANVRELSQLLRPVILDDFGLDAALRWLAEGFSQRTGIIVNYDSNLDVRLEDQTETHLFRIAQEALTNVARHSGATVVEMGLHFERSSVRLTIEDNGRGLAQSEPFSHSSLGMVGMRARAREAGGELSVTNGPAGGVRIEARIPVRRLACASS